MGNSITERIVYSINLELDAPLCVSGGEAEYTDSDIQRDFDGVPFVPGTSLAGAARDYLVKTGKDTSLFGTEGRESRMSALFVSDFRFEKNPKISIRDGVKLKNKVAVATGKYDMEIIETGARGTFELEIINREEDTLSSKDKDAMVKEILSAIDSGDIRLGANKNRGFGKMKVVKVCRESFTSKNTKDWIAYCAGERKLAEYQDWKTKTEDIFVTLSYELTLDGGISIRKYSMVPDAPDYEHIKCAKKPVIPGTSLNGAIRARAGWILEELGYPVSKVPAVLDEWFGYIEKNDAKQSEIIISESVLEGGEELFITRVKVNRFASSAVESALYKETAHFGGNTQIEVKIRKQHRDCDAMCGLMLLVLKDLANGYLAVGGQTSIGRGILKGSIDVTNESRYLMALKEFIETEE